MGQLTTEKPRTVTLDNAIVTSAQMLNLSQKRILMLAISRLDGRKSDKQQLAIAKDGTIEISADEYAELADIKKNDAYKEIKRACISLMKVQIETRHPIKVRGKMREKVRLVQWLNLAEYVDAQGKMKIAFSPQVLPLLTNLKAEFTTYRLQQAYALRSLYSIRLLELLSQWRNVGHFEIDIDDFHHAVESPATYKSNFSRLRQKCIEPAVRELTEKDGWLIKWEPIKAGRRVARLRFEFERDPQGRLDV